MQWNINQFIRDLQDAESEAEDPPLIKPQTYKHDGGKPDRRGNTRGGPEGGGGGWRAGVVALKDSRGEKG